MSILVLSPSSYLGDYMDRTTYIIIIHVNQSFRFKAHSSVLSCITNKYLKSTKRNTRNQRCKQKPFMHSPRDKLWRIVFGQKHSYIPGCALSRF